VHGPVALEVGWQVLVRVAPAAGPVDVDLAAADRVPGRAQHTQLVRDPLDPAVLVDDRLLPLTTRSTAGARERVATVSTTMMTAEPMIARGAHYTALLDTIDHRGATKLNAREREQLLEAADVLLFGETDSERTVRRAEVLIEELETSKPWSVQSCDRLREHLYGCGAPTGAS
jgi:hypothetical protein